jgi:hypothetical protein
MKSASQGIFEALAGVERPPLALDAQYLLNQRNWSRQTFGPAQRLSGVLDHLAKEIEEVREHPEDVLEWADLLILVFDGALRQGHYPQEIIDAVHEKFGINRERTWPDWRDLPEDQAIEHVRDGD